MRIEFEWTVFNSVTKFVEISPLWKNGKSLWQFLGLILYMQRTLTMGGGKDHCMTGLQFYKFKLKFFTKYK